MRNSEKKLIIKGAREHNLKNVDLEIPRNSLVVFSGLSGSGKSSLVNEILYKHLTRDAYSTHSYNKSSAGDDLQKQ